MLLVGLVLDVCVSRESPRIGVAAGIDGLEAFTPIYVGEVAPVNLRGALNVSYTFWFAGGQLIGNLVLQRTTAVNPLEYKGPIYSQVSCAVPSSIYSE